MKPSVFGISSIVALPLLTLALLVPSASAQTHLLDNFTLWTSGSPFLDKLAAATSSPSGTFVAPLTTFIGQSGLQMSGLTADYTMTGMQSLETFSAPFSVVAQVTPIRGTANPFAVYLVSADLSQYLSVYANVNPVYEGFWVDAPNIDGLDNLGEQFSPNFVPQMNTEYKVVIEVNTQGAATVRIYSGCKLLGSRSDAQAGTGPFYLVIGQKIGLAPTGSQVADWSRIEVHRP